MKVLHTIADFHAWRHTLRAGVLTPFVPTMGALHEGHASLVRAARKMAGRATDGGAVIASIFVNPTQFGPNEDFTRYPRTLETDCALLESAGCDAVLAPSAQDMYVTNARDAKREGVTVDPGPLGAVLEGAIRPGHFRGVCTVVAKLLHIVQPSHLLLGQKDFQQQVILRQMVADLNLPLEVVTCPTVREPDGLAMSSRNRYLSPDERIRAPALFEALVWARNAWKAGEWQATALEAGMVQRVAARGLVPQYAVVADATTLSPMRDYIDGKANNRGVLLIAAKLGATRLIDNMLLWMHANHPRATHPDPRSG
jgi:pantoate--beta-alanine ligase